MFKMHNAQRGGHMWPMPKNTFFSPENDGGTPPPAAAAAEDTGNGAGTGSGAAQQNLNNDEKIYSKSEFEAAFGPRAKRAEETAVRNLLSKLQFEKPEDLEAFLTQARQKADAELSETERLKKALETAPKAETVQELQTQADRYREEVKKHVGSLIKELNIPTHFTALLETMEPLAQLEYINKHRDSFKTAAKAPNLNGGDKGGTAAADVAKKRKESVKSRIPALSKRR